MQLLYWRYPFIIPIFVWLIIQVFKVIVDIVIEKRINLSNPFRSGWFPSVHSWVSSSICTMTGLYAWYDSLIFAIVLWFSILWWYDAMTVRYEAGQHAKQLNDLTIELRDILKIRQNAMLLKERLGHTLFEVIWWVLIWAILTIIVIWIIDPRVAFDYYFTNRWTHQSFLHNNSWVN